MNGLIIHRGAALIEVLLAFAVFSVGILGTFSMQIAAKKVINDAAQQSIATSLARDVLARMRANPSALGSYVVDDIGGEELQYVDECGLDVCSNVQMARRDIYEWSELLIGEQEQVVIDGQDVATGGLVDAQACVKNDDGIVRVSISWRNSNGVIGVSELPCGERVLTDYSPDEKFSALSMASYMVVP